MQKKINKKKLFIFVILPLLILLISLLCFSFGSVNSSENQFSDLNNTLNNEISNIEIPENNTIIVDIENEKSSNDEKLSQDMLQYILNELSKNTSYINIGDLELPVEGSTGYASINMPVMQSPSFEAQVVKNLVPGEAFKILQEKNNWWQIEVDNLSGWVDTTYCMINLPDVIPSIIYDNTNSYSSMFMSSGRSLPNITGKALYNAKGKNSRLEKEEFMMPILYSTSKKICVAQQLALKDGNSLKIYESFRPYSTQKSVASALKQLINTDEVVKNGINTRSWNESWFISQSLSDHQRGVAIDVSLVKVKSTTTKPFGNYTYTLVTDYEEYTMPTKMHELSATAATFKYGVSSNSQTAWLHVPLSKTMNNPAKKLQSYCTSANLTPLASEWWHFSDLETRKVTNNKKSTGNYFITKCYSSAKI